MFAESAELPKLYIFRKQDVKCFESWYEKLWKKYNGKCPECGHMLPLPKCFPEGATIEIKEAEK